MHVGTGLVRADTNFHASFRTRDRYGGGGGENVYGSAFCFIRVYIGFTNAIGHDVYFRLCLASPLDERRMKYTVQSTDGMVWLICTP